MAEQSILQKYPDYECVIGMEVHVQLTTKSKIFCRSSNQVTKEPNINICEICAGYPGVLPVLNKKVVDYAILAGLATNCTINRLSKFDRKHYFYPDLPKGYQITQNDYPICIEGHVPIRLEDGSIKKIRLNRIHMEEDAGKNIHAPDSNESFVNLNRAGTPLLEMVSYPDISSSYEARTYLKTIRAIVQYLTISTGNMEEGAFRADTNISVRKKGQKKLGTKVELKNINSFKFISDAIEYEIERQIELIKQGGKVQQETRLWDTKERRSIIMRTKEEAADYRYFVAPDLPFVEVTDEWIERIKTMMPELPMQKFERYVAEGRSEYEAGILVEDIDLAHYFEQAREHTKSKHLINWVLRDLLSLIKEEKILLSECKVTPEKLAGIVNLAESGFINNRAAQEVFKTIAQTGQSPDEVVKEKGLEQIEDTAELERIVKEIVEQNPQQVEQYKAGKDRLFGFFVGQAMKMTKGKGNPKVLQELLKKYLS